MQNPTIQIISPNYVRILGKTRKITWKRYQNGNIGITCKVKDGSQFIKLFGYGKNKKEALNDLAWSFRKLIAMSDHEDI